MDPMVLEDGPAEIRAATGGFSHGAQRICSGSVFLDQQVDPVAQPGGCFVFFAQYRLL